MKNLGLYFPFFMVFLLIIVIVGRGLLEYNSVLCHINRIDSVIEPAMLSGFIAYDLEKYANRSELSKLDSRNIVLNKEKSKKIVKEQLIKVLFLNADLSLTKDSFLLESPKINRVDIYNPDDLPATISGESLKYTTIVLDFEFSLKLPLAGRFTRHSKKYVISADSFLIDEQR